MIFIDINQPKSLIYQLEYRNSEKNELMKKSTVNYIKLSLKNNLETKKSNKE